MPLFTQQWLRVFHVCYTPTIASMTLQWNADYHEVVGKKKIVFLQQCSQTYNVSCINVWPGSIIVEMQVAAGGQPTDLRKVLQQITSEGFLPKTEFVIQKQNFKGIVREGVT